MYENSGSQFFRITTRIHSGPDAIDIFKLDMTFLTNWEFHERYTASDYF